MAGERKVRYVTEIDTSDVAAQAKRANDILLREQQKSAQQQLRSEQQIARLAAERSRAETVAATARQRAGQEYLRSERELQRAVQAETSAKQQQVALQQQGVRLAAEQARTDAAATNARQRQLNEALRVQTQMQRLAQEQQRTETQAAQAKIRVEQDALRLRQQQANVAAAEARAARAGQAPAVSGGGVSSFAGLVGTGLATLGISMGVRELAQLTTGLASLNVNLTRSRQAFTALSGGSIEAEKRLNAIQRASANTMTSLDAMNLANRMTALQMADSAKEMETAVAAARKIAVVMGTDTIGAIENLALAASNVSFLRLDQMGISATAVRERMKELRSENSALGREQAFLQAALQVSAETLKDVDVSGRDAASGVEALVASWGRLKETVATGAVGRGANSFLIGLSDFIDREWGQGQAKFDAQRRDFNDVLADRRNPGFLTTPGDLGQGAHIEATIKRLDDAISEGIPGLESYYGALSHVMEVWVMWGDLTGSPKSLATLEEFNRLLDRLAETGSGYAQMQKSITENSLEQSAGAQSLLLQQKQLEQAYLGGRISASGYEASTKALNDALVMLQGNLSETSDLTDDVRDAMREAAAAQDLFARSGGSLGALSGPLTAAQAALYGPTSRYLGQGGVIDLKTGAPQLDPKSGARVLQQGAWGYVPGVNDGSEMWEWQSEQRKAAEDDRQRIAREEEQAAKEWQRAAEKTQKEMEAAAKKMAQEFESALGKVPGLLGTSSVTQEQLDMAAAGVPQNFADDYLRQLTDEVVNKKDWAGVDINDAKRRAGIAPGINDEMALAIFRSKWGDQSLFANGQNLDLINKGAVQADLARQQASASGRNAILGMFGLQGDAVPNFAGNAAVAAQGGPLDQAVVQGDVMAMVATMQSQVNTEEVTKSLNGIGATLAQGIHSGFVSEVDALDWRGPIVNNIASEVTTLVAGSLADAIKP